MRIRQLCDVDPRSVRPSVMALGLFDGVHLGHAALLSRTVTLARERGIAASVFTFLDNSFKSGDALLTFEDRMARFSSFGIDEVFAVRFSDVKDLSPRHFVNELLKDKLGAVCTVCGFNFRFGRGAAGDPALLAALLPSSECLPPVLVDGEPCSATRVRAAIRAGDLALAERLLGRPYAVCGKVIHGKALGRTAGIPTANLHAETLLPPDGVYLTLAELSGQVFPALTDVGVRPTVESNGELRAETHIPDFSGCIYDEQMTLTFIRRLREERVFPTPEDLWAQVRLDLSAFREAVASGELPRPYRADTKPDFRKEF